MTATIVTAIVVAQANREVATVGGRPAAAYSLKNGGKTATMTVDQNAELAQSYIAQARSSRPSQARCARARCSRSEGPPRHPLPQQRVDDDVPAASRRSRSCLTSAASDVWMLDGPPRR